MRLVGVESKSERAKLQPVGKFLRLCVGVWMGAIGILFLLGANCQGARIHQQDAQELARQKEARLVEQAKSAQKKQRTQEEKRAWRLLLRSFPKSRHRERAWFRLGRLAYAKKHWKVCVRFLRKALRGGLTKGDRRVGLLEFGTALQHLKEYSEALQAFANLYPEVGAKEQRRLRGVLVRLARWSEDDFAVLQWESRRLTDLQGKAKEATKQRILAAIQGRLSPTKLRVMFEQRGEKPSFPFGWIGLRLARSYFHQRAWAAGRDILVRLKREWKAPHVIHQKVQEELQRIARQKPQVQSHVIGVLYPKTGRYRRIGKWVRNAAKLAVDGMEKKLRFVFADTGSDPEIAVQSFERLVHQEKAIAVFGPVGRDTSRAVARRAEALEVPLFSISSEEGLADMGRFVFRNNLTLTRMGRAMARYAVEYEKLTKFAILYPNNRFGRLQTAGFWKEAERLGASVVGVETFDPHRLDVTKPVRKLVGRYHVGYRPEWVRRNRKLKTLGNSNQYERLKKKLRNELTPVLDFDAVFVPSSYKRVAMVAPTLVQQEVELKSHSDALENEVREVYQLRRRYLKFIQLLGTNGWNNEDLFRMEPRHVVGAVFCVRYFPYSGEQIVQSFVRAYQEKFASQVRTPSGSLPPAHVSAYTFDTMKILLSVAGEKDAPKTRDAFREALLKVQDFAGVTGAMSIQPNGEALAHIRYLMAHEDKAFRLHTTARTWIQ